MSKLLHSLPSKIHFSRRFVLLFGLAGCTFDNSTGATQPAAAQDRSANTHRANQRNISCQNASVPVSSEADRRVAISAFKQSDACKLTKDSFEGPYFTCTKPVGKDISDDRIGAPLTVALRVTDENCEPVPGAIVDIWACDAEGNYSAYDADPDEFARSGRHQTPSNQTRFCRGVLATGRDGIAEFDTIYPGYYAGRAIHIHYKVHIGDQAYITRQALFPEAVNARVLATAPYNKTRNTLRVTNEDDDVSLGMFNIVETDDRLITALSVSVAA